VAKLMARLRIAARLFALLAVLLGSVTLYYLCRLLRLPNPWPRRFLRAFGRVAGARVRVHGEPLRAPGVLIANHVSWLDIPVLAGVTGTAFVAHSGLAENPLLARLCAMNDTVFIAREDRANVAAQVRQVRQALDRPRPLTIFAEGTTSDGAGLLPFKSALLSALDPPPPGILVQPVWLDYGPASAKIAWFGDEPGLANVLRVLARPGRVPIALHFLEPFDPGQAGSRKQIAALARARIEAARSAHRLAPG
jgi:1-acyl-sn-glycerol-3-phosphate acyltransferase